MTRHKHLISGNNAIQAKAPIRPGMVSTAPTGVPDAKDVGKILYEPETGVWAGQADGWTLIQAPPDPGISLIDADTFTGVASVAVDDVFTSAYRNYRLFLYVDALSNDNVYLELQIRAAGVTTATNYDAYEFFQESDDPNNTTWGEEGENDTEWKFLQYLLDSTTARAAYVFDLFAPQIATRTFVTGGGTGYQDDNTVSVSTLHGGQRSTTAHDGFLISPSAGTFGGSYKLYGWADTPGTAAIPTLYQPLDASLTLLAALDDPGADKIVFWDESANAFAFLEPADNLSITDTDLDATGGGGTTSLSDIIMLGGM
jgi:hypothetical protein